MNIWASHLINGGGLLFGFWLGGHLSQRQKGWPLIGMILGFSIISLSDQWLLPHAYVYSSSHHNNFFGHLAMAASNMLFVTGAVYIKDATIAFWKADRSRKHERRAVESRNTVQ